MLLTTDNLRLLAQGFNAAFVRGIESVTPTWQQIAVEVPSTSSAENYGWMKDLPGVREWIGQRVINNLEATDAVLRNKTWEHTIGVNIDDLEDNERLGVYGMRFAQQGEIVASHPDNLVWGLLRDGFTELGFDGQPFFDADHISHDVNGKEVSWSNVATGTEAPWFLMDLSRTWMKPLLFQMRKPPEFVQLDRPDDPKAVWENQYIYAVKARYNAGFAFHQLAFGSQQALTPENYQAARVAMTKQYRTDGTPLAVRATHLIVGPGNEAAALELLQAERNAMGATNIYRGTTQLIVSPHLE